MGSHSDSSRLPLVVHSLHLGRDIDELRDAISQHIIDVDISLCADTQILAEGYLACTGDSDLQIAFIQYGLNAIVQCQQDDVFCLVIPFDGQHVIEHCHSNQEHDDPVCFLPPLAQLNMYYSSNCGHLVLRFKNSAFHQEAFSVIVKNNYRLPYPLQEELKTLAHGFTKTCLLVDQHDDAQQHITCFKNEVYDLLIGQQASIYNSNVHVKSDLTRNVISYFHDNRDWRYDLNELVTQFNIPVRTLYWHFKRYTGLTPYKTYLNIKLCRARLDILKFGRRLSITDIASKHGFSHLGRFSMQYKQLFGELPKSTMQSVLSRKRYPDLLL